MYSHHLTFISRKFICKMFKINREIICTIRINPTTPMRIIIAIVTTTTQNTTNAVDMLFKTVAYFSLF